MAIWTHDYAVPAGRKASTAVRPVGALFVVWAVLIAAAALQDAAGLEGGARIWVLDVDIEDSLYTWFSQLMLAGAALLLWDTGQKIGPADRRLGVQWMALGGLFLFLLMDEALSFHERLSSLVRSALDTSGFLTFAWVIPVGLLCIVGFIALIPFLRELPARVRNMMIVSAVLFLGGALGMELVGAKIFSDAEFETATLAYRFSVIVEEGLEGLGVLVFISAILLYRRERGIATGIGAV